MKKFFTELSISKAVTLLILALIAANSLLVTLPAFAQPMNGESQAGVEEAIDAFCAKKEKTDVIESSEVEICQRLDGPLQKTFSMFKGGNNKETSDVRKAWLSGTSLQDLGREAKKEVKEEAWIKKIKAKIGDDNDDLLALIKEKENVLKYLWGVDPTTLDDFEPIVNRLSPADVADAIRAFCAKEEEENIIDNNDINVCERLNGPLQKTFFMFKGGNNEETSDVRKAWLSGTSLQDLGREAKTEVEEEAWVKKLKAKVGDDNDLLELLGKKEFQDDLWEYEASQEV